MPSKSTPSAAETREICIRLVEAVRAIPYRWPGAPGAAAAARDGAGTCASKHALLADRLAEVGIASSPLLLVGPLLPEALRQSDEFRAAADLLEVHECLTVHTPWTGPLVVDITWDPPLIRRGLPGALWWNGMCDMPYAIVPEGRAWAVPRDGLRAAKKAIRARLYTAERREVRDRALGRLSEIYSEWRRADAQGGVPAE